MLNSIEWNDPSETRFRRTCEFNTYTKMNIRNEWGIALSETFREVDGNPDDDPNVNHFSVNLYIGS